MIIYLIFLFFFINKSEKKLFYKNIYFQVFVGVDEKVEEVLKSEYTYNQGKVEAELSDRVETARDVVSLYYLSVGTSGFLLVYLIGHMTNPANRNPRTLIRDS